MEDGRVVEFAQWWMHTWVQATAHKTHGNRGPRWANGGGSAVYIRKYCNWISNYQFKLLLLRLSWESWSRLKMIGGSIPYANYNPYSALCLFEWHEVGLQKASVSLHDCPTSTLDRLPRCILQGVVQLGQSPPNGARTLEFKQRLTKIASLA